MGNSKFKASKDKEKQRLKTEKFGIRNPHSFKRNIDESLEEYEKLAEIEPENLYNLYQLVNIYSRRGLIYKAVDIYLKIVDIRIDKSELDIAREICHKIIRLSPENTEAREKLIKIYEYKTDRESIRKECLSLYKIYNASGKKELALRYLKKGTEMAPHNPATMLKLAEENIKIGAISEGINQYRKIACHYYETEDFPRAIETYKKIIKLQMNDTESYTKLGSIYRDTEQFEEAKNSYRHVLRKDPDNIPALEGLSEISAEMGEVSAAIMTSKRILELAPHRKEIRKKLAELYKIQGNTSKAVQEYSNLIKSYDIENNKDELMNLCEKITSIMPQHSEAKNLLMKFKPQPSEKPSLPVRKKTPIVKLDNIDIKRFIKPAPSYEKRSFTEGTMVTGDKNLEIPLKYIEMRSTITGMIADVSLSQKFHNNSSETIEAIYLFPLPGESAVYFLEIKMKNRTIKSQVKEKKEAKKIYEEAKNENKKAALLEEERPNLFTMSVTGIEPGEEILVNLKYYQVIKYEDGEYEFVFPMTITPRYTDNTTPDRERISHPVYSGEEKREVNIFVTLDTGFKIEEITSPSHLLYIQEKGPSKREVQLAREGEIPNKGFVLRYSSKEEDIKSTFYFHRKEGRDGIFMAHLSPKADYGPEEMVKREVIFVLDRSGSMAGEPIKQARNALKACLRTLRAGDSFSIITFDDRIEYLSENSLLFTEKNLSIADNYIETINARGLTDILGAMKQALSIPADKDYLRQIVFLTDGAVSNEMKVMSEIEKLLGKGKIFSFGIGNAVNRHFLDKMAEMGRGTSHYILADENIEEAIQKFANQTSFPILVDITLEWEGKKTSHIYPAPLPDLYFGQTIYIIGKYNSKGKIPVTVRGRMKDREFVEKISPDFPEKEEGNTVLETIWAKRHMDNLLKREKENPLTRHEVREEIIGISMKYHLVSPYTSLAVIDEKIIEEQSNTKVITVKIPTLMPEGIETGRASKGARPALNIASPLSALNSIKNGSSSAPAPGEEEKSNNIPEERPALNIKKPSPFSRRPSGDINLMQNMRATRELDSPLPSQAIQNMRATRELDSPLPHQTMQNMRATRELDSPLPHQTMQNMRATRELDSPLPHQAMQNMRATRELDSSTPPQAIQNMRADSERGRPRAAEPGSPQSPRLPQNFRATRELASPLFTSKPPLEMKRAPEKIEKEEEKFPSHSENSSHLLSPYKTASLTSSITNSSPEEKSRECSPVSASENLKLTIKWLIRNQKAGGFWSNENTIDKKIISTGAALLFFTGMGHTGRTGNYRPHLSKSLYYVEQNWENLSGLPLAITAIVFFELYNISKKKKDRNMAEKLLETIKSRWTIYNTNLENFFLALSAKSAVYAGLAENGEFSELDNMLKSKIEEVYDIERPEDLLAMFIITQLKNIKSSSLLKNYYIKKGDNEGSIIIPGLSHLDTTAMGAFILYWPESNLMLKEIIKKLKR